MRYRLLAPALLVACVLATPSLAAAQSIADYNVNPLAKVFASDSGAYGTVPSGGANGNTNPYFPYNSSNFYHSGTNLPWWYVDLGASYDIGQITFYFRGDCCPGQNDGNFLELWSSPPAFGPASGLFRQVITYASSPTQVFNLATPISARYVSIYAGPTSNNAIVLNELDVRGTLTDPTVTPEPATLGLLATGLIVLGGVARRRKGSVVSRRVLGPAHP